jgi:hypothetical protein
MTGTFSLVCLLIAAGAPTPASKAEAVQQFLDRRIGPSLDPAQRPFPVDAGQANRVLPTWQQYPSPLPPKAHVNPPLPALPAHDPARPHLMPEPLTLGEITMAALDLPKSPKLPAGELVKQWAPSAATPPPLPYFGAYIKDRASLADPSLEASTGMTRAPQSPVRAGEVPFMPWNLPDPFENRTTIQLRQPWAETPEPPIFANPPTRR